MSGLGHLCAAGVTFLVLVAVTRELRRRGYYAKGTPEPDLMGLLDLVALATVADVVPLTGLNRAYVAQGLQVMRRRKNIGLKALSDAASLNEAPTPYHLGFILGPRINAGGRIGDAGLGARLLAGDDEIEAGRIAILLDRLNKERRALEKEMLEAALAEADAMVDGAPRSPVPDGRVARLAQRHRGARREPPRRALPPPGVRHRLGGGGRSRQRHGLAALRRRRRHRLGRARSRGRGPSRQGWRSRDGGRPYG